MKIKHLAIAILCTTLISSPLFAKDKVKPVKVTKSMDAASPAAAVDQTTDELEVVESQKEISPRDAASGMATGKRISNPESTPQENSASDVFIKIDDIEGESTKASSSSVIKELDKSSPKSSETVQPDRIEFKNAVATDGDIDVNEDGELGSDCVEEVECDQSKVSDGTVPHIQYGKYSGAIGKD